MPTKRNASATRAVRWASSKMSTCRRVPITCSRGRMVVASATRARRFSGPPWESRPLTKEWGFPIPMYAQVRFDGVPLGPKPQWPAELWQGIAHALERDVDDA